MLALMSTNHPWYSRGRPRPKVHVLSSETTQRLGHGRAGVDGGNGRTLDYQDIFDSHGTTPAEGVLP